MRGHGAPAAGKAPSSTFGDTASGAMDDSDPAASPRAEFVGTVPEPLWTFAYVSRPTVPFSDVDLRQLHLAAQDWNHRHRLTGRLVVVETDGEPVRFVQCVEGPRHDLAACSRRIFADPRHGDVEMLRSTQIAARMFGEWSMQFETVSQADVGTDLAVALWGADVARTVQMSREIRPLEPPPSAA